MIRPPFGSMVPFPGATRFDADNGWLTEQQFQQLEKWYLDGNGSMELLNKRPSGFIEFPREGMRPLEIVPGVQAVFDGYSVAVTENDDYILVGNAWFEMTEEQAMYLKMRRFDLIEEILQEITRLPAALNYIDPLITRKFTVALQSSSTDYAGNYTITPQQRSLSIIPSVATGPFGTGVSFSTQTAYWQSDPPPDNYSGTYPTYYPSGPTLRFG